MIIYQPYPMDNYEWLNCCEDKDYDLLASLDGSIIEEWTPVRVRRVPADEQHGCRESDFPWHAGYAPVVRKNALGVLENILTRDTQVLPLEVEDDVELFLLNVRTIDALDLENSEVEFFPETNHIMRIKRHAFRPSAIRDCDMFRLPHRASPTYCSQRVVGLIEQSRLEGIDFKEVWRASN